MESQPSPALGPVPPAFLLVERLAALPDPRVVGRVEHPLKDVLFTAVMAVMSDCDDYTGMATFAQTQLDWLRLYVPLPQGAPSHDVFRNVFMLLEPTALLDIATEWVGELRGRHVCIDGKVSRGAKDSETGRSRLHLLRAWVHEAGLSVGQAACADKSNELSTLPALLAGLHLRGAVVSIDAMAGHPEVAQQLHQAGADYLLALKANEPHTHQSVARKFKQLSGQTVCAPPGMEEAEALWPPEIMPCSWSAECHRVLSQEKNRGRYEQREVITVAVSDDWLPKGFLWYGLKTAVCVVRRCLRQRQQTEAPLMEVHYYLSSLPATQVDKIAQYIRQHWSVEAAHHLLDVTFAEDDCQVRDPTAAHNFTLLREISAKILRDHPRKDSIRSKRKRCSLSPAFRSEVLKPYSPLF